MEQALGNVLGDKVLHMQQQQHQDRWLQMNSSPASLGTLVAEALKTWMPAENNWFVQG